MIISSLYIAESPGRGRGVFSSAPIASGKVIEISPVIVLGPQERTMLDQTILHDYIFLWGLNEKECCIGLGYLSIYNHSERSNAEYVMNFAERTIAITTVRDIKKGEEIFINYNGTWNDPKPVWFQQAGA